MGTETYVLVNIGYTKGAQLLGNKSISSYRSADNVANQYGGINFRLNISDLQETVSDTQPALFNLDSIYPPVDGEMNFWVEGPTASGIQYMLRRFEEIADNAERYWSGEFPFPVYIMGELNQGSILYKAKLELPSDLAYQASVLKKCKVTFKYTRAGLSLNGNDGNISDSINPTNINTRLPVPLSTTGRTKELGIVSEGAIVFGSRGTYVPSGFFIYNSNENYLRLTSAYNAFYAPSTFGAGPTQFAAYNEDSNLPYSMNASGGVFGFRPTNTNKIVSSGFTYLNMLSIPDVSDPYKAVGTDIDFYATVKTTYSGTRFAVSLLAGDTSNLFAESDQVILQNYPVPTPVFIGTMKVPANISQVKYQLAIQADVASGILQIDQFVFNGGDGIGKRAIKFNGQNLDINSTSNATYIAFNGNYFPQEGSFDSDFYNVNYTTLRFWKSATTLGANPTSSFPSYEGNIDLMYKQTPAKLIGGYEDIPAVALLMCGATWASGTRNYWMATTTSGTKSRYNASMSYDYAELIPQWLTSEF